MTTPAARRVSVELTARLGEWAPDAREIWDYAHALGLALLDRHRGVEQCTVCVHARRRDSLRWCIDDAARLEVHWALTPHAEAVLDVVGGDEGAWKRLRTRLPAQVPPKTRARGRVYDLVALLESERKVASALGVPDAPSVLVTWGRYGKRPRHGLRLGSCEPSDPPLLRIHPVLDHESVPGWFVGFVLFHELLHVVFPPETGASRRLVHTDTFRQAEERHPRYREAIVWEAVHLPLLLARCTAR